MKNPIQPLAKDAQGVLRFKENSLVRALLDHGQATGLGLNELARKFYAPEHADEAMKLLAEARRTFEMWKDVAPAVSLCADIDAAIAKSKEGK